MDPLSPVVVVRFVWIATDSLCGSMARRTPHTRRPIEDVFIDIEDCSASSSGKKLFFFLKGVQKWAWQNYAETPWQSMPGLPGLATPEAVGEGAWSHHHKPCPPGYPLYSEDDLIIV